MLILILLLTVTWYFLEIPGILDDPSPRVPTFERKAGLKGALELEINGIWVYFTVKEW